MNVAVMAVFVAVVPASLLAMVMCLAIGVSLGPSRIVVRLPIFLAGTLLFATLVSLGESNTGVWPMAFVSVLVSSLAWGLRDQLVGVIAACLVLPMTIGVVFVVGSDTFATRSFTATTFALCLLAGFVSILRLAGFRLTTISREASATDLRLATGRDIRQWIDVLDSSGANVGNYANTIQVLRDFELTSHWRKVIGKAYERSVGRLPIERTSDGRNLFAISKNSSELVRGLLAQLRHRFTISQLLVWSFCAALLFGFIRLLPPLDVSGESILIAIPTASAMTIVSLLSLHAILSLRLRWFRGSHYVLVIAVTSLIFPMVLGLFPGDPIFFWLIAWLLTTLSLWFSAACLVAREQGLVLVQVTRSHPCV